MRNVPSEQSAPPPEWSAPPEHLPPQEYAAPAEPIPGAETAPLPPEFLGSGASASPRGNRSRIWRMAAALLSLTLLIAAFYNVDLPKPDSIIPSVPPVTEATEPTPTEPAPTEPIPTEPQSEPDVETAIYTATVNGSFSVLDVTFAQPETIVSAKITQFDLNTQRAFYEDVFGDGIPQDAIDAGHYTVSCVLYPPDILAYWDEVGEDSFPDFEFRLTIARQNGEVETYTAQQMGAGPEIRRSFDPEAGRLELSLYRFQEENYVSAACGVPEEAVGDTISVMVMVDGQPVPLENYQITYRTEELQISSAGNPEELVTITNYFTVITATLPQPHDPAASVTFTLDMELSGHPFVYTESLT